MSKKMTLSCKVCLSRNYTIPKNTSGQTTRMELKKYCKECNQHTLHQETK